MKYIVLILAISFSSHLTAISQTKHQLPHNTLSSTEKKEGWQLLFDGVALDKWRGFKTTNIPAWWRVEDGSIVMRNLSSNAAEDLLTLQEFTDFELTLEWKISDGGNSGIMFYVSCDSQFHSSSETGPEVQVLDDEKHPDGRGESGLHRAGATYDLYPARKDVVKPVGEFNHVRIRVYKGRVQNWLNGKKIVDYTLLSPEWEAKVANSKFAKCTSYGRLGKGHIALQDHGHMVWYRNIKIRKL